MSVQPIDPVFNHPAEPGALGHYVVDGTKVFGLFIMLGDHKAFVDIKEDKFFEQRKLKALQLYQDQYLLSKNLATFIQSQPNFYGRRVAYIGLHSNDMQQGEVFWDPSGYTLLKGCEFQP